MNDAFPSHIQNIIFDDDYEVVSYEDGSVGESEEDGNEWQHFDYPTNVKLVVLSFIIVKFLKFTIFLHLSITYAYECANSSPS